jgi:hypothetical protein
MDCRSAKKVGEIGVNMLKSFFHVALLFFLTGTFALAAGNDKKENVAAKVISGMSIVGNSETPTSLVIVPWKSSEIGKDTKLQSNLLNDGLTPVDRAVFMRELDFYQFSNSK